MINNFYFIRHGETDWNKERIFQGHNDISLNENGREQARLRQRNFKVNSEVVYFSSPLKRALETAEIVTDQKDKIHLIPELKECKSPETARYLLELKGEEDFPKFDKLIPGSETPNEFIDRVNTGLIKTFEVSDTRTPVIFAHGGTCTAICLLLNIEFFGTPNCSMFYFKKNTAGFEVQFL